jgi:PAS domain S-box-containing protein
MLGMVSAPAPHDEVHTGPPTSARDFEIYWRLFEEAGDILFAATADGALVQINRRAEDLTGLPRHDLLGRTYGSLIADADRDRGLADFALAAGGVPVRAQYRLQTPYGEVWFQVSLQPVRLADGRLLVHGIARDVQAQRDLETQLERHNAELQSLLDACTAIGIRRTFDELARSIAFEAFQLIRRSAAITLYAARAPGAAPEIVAVAGRSSRVGLDGTMLDPDDDIHDHVQRALESRKSRWSSDNVGFPAPGGGRVSSLAVVPLLADAGGRVVGAILAETHGDELLADDAVALLRAFADRAAAAVDNLSLSEERLRIADEQYAIVENLGDGVLILDSAHRVVDANPAAVQMLASWSLATEEVVQSPGEWSMARLDGTALPASELPSTVAIREGRSVAQRSLILRTAAGDRIVTISAEPLHKTEATADDARGAPYRAATVVFRDMTRQIALMTELERRASDLSAEKEAFRRYAQALSQFEDGVVITSPTGRVEEWLGAAPRLFGLGAAEVVGHSIGSILVAAEDREPFEQALGRPAGWSREVVLQRRHASPLAALITASPVQDDAGAIVAQVFLVKDVTEQRKLRDSFSRSQRLEGLGTLAGGVAHEINNPLAVLSMNLSTLKEVHDRLGRLVAGAAAERAQIEARELVEESVHAAARIASIVRTLHVFRRPHGDDAADVSVSQLVDAAAAVAFNEIRHRAVLIKQYEAAGAMVRANAQELELAILNVIVNAVQAIPEGDVERNRIVLRIGQVEDQVRIEIEDTGCGIPEELRAGIFDPFVTSKPGERTGLGMSITLEVVTRLGGRVALESQEGRGTRVAILLPAVARPPAVAGRVAATAQRRRILVVEDEPYLRKAYRRILASRYDVVEAGSGEDGLACMREERFDLVLCDLQMPGMNGADLYDKSLAEGVAAPHEFLFVTGGAFTPHVKAFAEAHADRCLLKPVEVAVLLQRIEHEIGGRAA